MYLLPYALPIAAALLLIAFFSGLPALHRCALPRAEARRFTGADACVLGLIMLVYGAAAFYQLGNTASPETFTAMENRSVTLTLPEDGEPAAVYVINEECEPEYLECRWEYDKACVLHRFCVSPGRQNRGVGKQVLEMIEDRLSGMGYGSVRLDVFSENPYALRLYEKNGYVRRGRADWRKGRFWLMEKKLP